MKKESKGKGHKAHAKAQGPRTQASGLGTEALGQKPPTDSCPVRQRYQLACP